MRRKNFIGFAIAVFAAFPIAQAECTGGPSVEETVTVADATLHAGINLEYLETDLGGLVTRIWDTTGSFDVAEDLCVFVNSMEIDRAVAAFEVFPGDVVEWWVWELPSTPVSMVTSFIVE